MKKQFNKFSVAIMMKSFMAILFSLSVLLTGLNITVAEHFCKGTIAATKVSVTGEIASCGMENKTHERSADKELASKCCHDRISIFSLDNDYTPLSKQVKDFFGKIINVHLTTFISLFNIINLSADSATNVIPPGIIPAIVNLSGICVLRL